MKKYFSFGKFVLFLQLITLSVISSCTVPEKKVDKVKEKNYLLSLRVKPTWFKYRKDRSYRTSENRISHHPFFDFAPFVKLGSNTLNFFVVTPYKSETLFELDLSSGKRYRRHTLCGQDDIWESYKTTINTPLFTEGIVPRTLDQLGRPQKIWVFGDEDRLADFPTLYSHRVRVVGGIKVQECEFGQCQPNEWQSRVVLVAVAAKDKGLLDVFTLEDLKKRVNWNYVKGYAQNYLGHHPKFKKIYPSLRITGEISALNSLREILKPAQSLEKKDIVQITKSCHKLYDAIEKSLGPRSNKKGYYKRLRKFHEKFSDRVLTCMDYVQGSSVNTNRSNHWFFTYLEGFYRLHDLDYFVNCKKKSWIHKNDMQQTVNSKTYLSNCSDEDIEFALENTPFMFKRLSLDYRPSYRYIEYDSLRGGSHEKLYSWTKKSQYHLSCEENARKNEQYFPEDIRWAKRIISKDKRIVE